MKSAARSVLETDKCQILHPTVLYRKNIPDLGPDAWDLGLLLGRIVEYLGDHVWRVVGEMFRWFLIRFGRCLGVSIGGICLARCLFVVGLF